MSTAWSWWVIALIVFNLGVIFFLFLWAPWAKVPILEDGTTGHVWSNGAIREGMHRLPWWWIGLSFAMFVAAFAYFVLYPGFGKYTGVLGWTSERELAEDTRLNDSRLNPLLERLSALGVEQASQDPAIRQLGQRLFVDNCAACHGHEGRGNFHIGAPNLTDSDWIYGGSGEAISTSIHNGRMGAMPPWESLGEDAIKNLAQYVLSLQGLPHTARAAQMAQSGEPLFKTNCTACHGADGKGNQAIGAPNLTDSVWLYGGSTAQIEASIRHGRQGHMPAWNARLSDAQIHVLTAYVLHLSQASSQESAAQ